MTRPDVGAASGDADPWARVLPYRTLARLVDASLAIAAAGATVAVSILVQFVAIVVGLEAIEDAAVASRLPLAAAVLVVFVVYNQVWRVAARGGSLAKTSLGLQVRADGGGTLGLGAAIVRELVTLTLVPALIAPFRPDRRTGADLAAGSVARSRDASPPPGILRDLRVYQAVGQIVAVVVVLGFGYWLANNLFENLDEAGIGTDFGFLDVPTQFQIPFDDGFDPRGSVRSMVWVGVKNLMLAAFVGIVIATVLGTIIGVARLSSNWLVAKLAAIYVEVLRNTPPLIVIIFFGQAIFTAGPFPILSARSEPWTYSLPGMDSSWLILSNTVWGIPSLAGDGNTGLFWLAVLASLVVSALVWRWRTRVNVETGRPHHRVLWSLATFVVLGAIAYTVLGGPYQMSWPAVSESGRKIEGGFVMNFGWISVTLALGLYTASHIAEIIRGSILAVDRGQTEAANALALSGFQRYRFIVLPQAARIAIPPTINQYLNLTKNTSLGIAVAYAEITALTKSSIGNGRPAVQSLVILMAIYLMFSLLISVGMNQVNRRVQLVGR